jgi:hypothetical protein
VSGTLIDDFGRDTRVLLAEEASYLLVKAAGEGLPSGACKGESAGTADGFADRSRLPAFIIEVSLHAAVEDRPPPDGLRGP